MVRASPLTIDIPPSTPHPHSLSHSQPHPLDQGCPESPSGYFHKNDNLASFTRTGVQYMGSPSSTNSPMMTPLPYKASQPWPVPMASAKDDLLLNNNNCNEMDSDMQTKLGSYEFPAGYQSYLNHPFTQLRQQRIQEQQIQQNQQSKAQNYINKYHSYTNSSKNTIPAPTGFRAHAPSVKPSTMAALSMVENEKRKSVGYLPTHRDSLASPPPPPYRSSDHGGVVVPLSASAATTPSPLHFSVGAPVGAIPGHAASSARELKRHSLPAFRTNAAAAAGLQWPSAMTHSIARPKLARTMPPQAIPIFGTTSSVGTDDIKTPTTPHGTLFTPRMGKLMHEKGPEVETLYNYKHTDAKTLSAGTRASWLGFGKNARVAPAVTPSVQSQAQTMAQYQSQSQAAAAAAAKAGDTFPSFWEDAKQRRTHWIFYSVSTIALASLLCVFMMPIVAIWVAALPGAMTLIMAGQYSVYRWRRRQFYRRRGLANRSSSTSKTKTSTKPTQVPPVSTSTSSQPMNHSASSSLFSLSFAGSAKSRTGSDDGNGGQDTDSNGHSRVSSTSFLEPHQPPPDAQSSQFQHRYYGPASPDRMRSTGQIDEENGSEHPTPRFMGALQRHGSMSSLASSETVSSTSTSTTTSEDPCHLDLEPFSSSHTMVQAQQLLSSRTSPTNSSSHGIAMPPPPAYVSKKCDQMVVVTSILHHNGNGSGILGTNTISTALPEIAPMGDLMSELSLDFGSFDY